MRETDKNHNDIGTEQCREGEVGRLTAGLQIKARYYVRRVGF